jgi:hypothetical protein
MSWGVRWHVLGLPQRVLAYSPDRGEITLRSGMSSTWRLASIAGCVHRLCPSASRATLVVMRRSAGAFDGVAGIRHVFAPPTTEVREVRAMVAKIAKAKPASDIAKASAACAKAADAVERALRGLPGPQSAYVKALGARDALLLTWQKALSRLRKHAAAAWDDDPATVKAVFSPPDAVVAPVKRRAKKAANGASPSPAPP